MSWAYKTWADEAGKAKRLPPITRHLLVQIACYVDERGRSDKLSITSLERLLGVTRNPIRRALDELTERGLLVLKAQCYRAEKYRGKVQSCHSLRLIRNKDELREALADGYDTRRRAISRERGDDPREDALAVGHQCEQAPPDPNDETIIAALRKAGGGKIPAHLLTASAITPIRAWLAEGCELQRDVVPVFEKTLPGLSGELRSLNARFLREGALANRDAARRKASATPAMAGPVFVEADTEAWQAWLAYKGKRSLPIYESRSGGRIRRGSHFPSPWPPGAAKGPFYSLTAQARSEVAERLPTVVETTTDG